MVAQSPSYDETSGSAALLISRLHGIVILGPWDLDIVAAMRPLGYDETRWAEGECLLAELVAADVPNAVMMSDAATWYEETARTARQALAGSPRLLARLGLANAKDAYH